jgi:hypothetical protein
LWSTTLCRRDTSAAARAATPLASEQQSLLVRISLVEFKRPLQGGEFVAKAIRKPAEQLSHDLSLASLFQGIEPSLPLSVTRCGFGTLVTAKAEEFTV